MNPIEIAIDALIEVLSTAWESARRFGHWTWYTVTFKCLGCGRRRGHKMDCRSTR